MRPVSEATARITGQSFSRKYIALGRVVTHWSQIVGSELAHKAQPVRLNYRKRAKNEKPEASLDIAASPSAATLLHYQKDLILERINQIFGERWITAIRFVAVAANEERRLGGRSKIPLTPQQKKSLSHILESAPDIALRERLEGLGREIMVRNG